MKKHLLIAIQLICATGFSVNAQNTIPDSLFGANSILKLTTTPGEIGSNFILQPDGKIIFGGYDYDINQNDFHIDMLRFDQCGIIDSSFGSDGYVRYKFSQRNIGYAYDLQADGKIVCAGLQAPSNSGSQQISGVSRFNADGTPDSTFNGTGSHALRYDPVSSGTFFSVFAMPDGRTLCIGRCSGNINGGVSGAGAMRFMADGSLDLSFNADGKALFTSSSFNGFGQTKGHLLNNGNIVLTTYVIDGGLNEHFFALQFDSTGTLDTNYAANGIYYDSTLVTSNSKASVSALQTDGKVLLAANHFGNGSIDVIRLTTDGTLDTTFGTGGHVNHVITNVVVTGMQVMSNGKILIRGGYTGGFGVGYGIMLHPNGSPDTLFGANGFRFFDVNNNTGTHALDDLLELPNGKWLAAGSSGDFIFRKFAAQSNVPHIWAAGNSLFSTGGINYQWYLNNNLIPLATNNTYNFTQNGSYTMMVTDADGCTYLSDSFVVANVGINEISLSGFQVFPNPVNDVLTIKNNAGAMMHEIKITDTWGRIVMKYAINNNFDNYNIDLTYLKSGVYFIEVNADKDTARIRMVKN